MARKHYTDKQRAAAVAMLVGMGYPDKKGALSSVATHTGIPLPTLYRWFHGVQNPPPSDLVNETKIDLAAAIRRELANLFPAMDGARLGANYKELATAAGILIDKLQLLEGKPTERVEHLESLLESLPPDEYDAIVAEAEEVIASTRSGHTGSEQETAE